MKYSATLSILSRTTLAIALALAGSATALAQAPQNAAPAETSAQALTITAEGAVRRPVAKGIYEAAYSPASKALYVASAEAITGTEGGVIYKLDPDTLQTLGQTHTDEKNFGLALSPQGDTLYITNSLASGLSAMDTETGKIKARVKFTERSKDDSAYGPRQVIYDPEQKALYVGGVGDPGIIWLVDAETLAVRATIPNAGKWVTGLLLDQASQRLYSANGDGEVLVIDTRENRILERWTPGDGKPYLLLNLALDAKRHRLFVTDHSQQKTVLAFDTRNGKVTERLDIGDSMGIKYNPARDELYVSHREQGTVSVVDAESLRTTKTYTLPSNPNSLLIGPDDKTLYVTIKTPFNKDYSASGEGSIARIELP
ncbi:MAG: YncE family protein [Pusillimonas sp.]